LEAEDTYAREPIDQSGETCLPHRPTNTPNLHPSKSRHDYTFPQRVARVMRNLYLNLSYRNSEEWLLPFQVNGFGVSPVHSSGLPQLS